MESKGIFSYNSDISKNSYINWQITTDNIVHDFEILAAAYADTSFMLIDRLLKNNTDKKADTFIFPLLFSLNQSIELYEKAIIIQINKLTNEPNCYPGTHHDIKQLYGEMCSKIKKKEPSCKGLERHFSCLKNYIDELYYYIVDETGTPLMDFARYPIDKDKNPHFYMKKDTIIIDLETLKEKMEDIIGSLRSMLMKYTAEWEGIQ